MDCDTCKYQKRGKKFPNLDPCRKGHSAFFTCCVDADCKDYDRKEPRHEGSEVQQDGNAPAG